MCKVTSLQELLDHPQKGEITEINLRNNNIGTEGAVALAGALLSVGGLQTLNLEWNNIGTEGAVALAGALSSLGKLEYLRCVQQLWHGRAGRHGRRARLRAGVGCRVQRAHEESQGGERGEVERERDQEWWREGRLLGILDNNNIGAEGAEALAEALSSCAGLEYLYLQNNNIGTEGAVALAGVLPSMKGLYKLGLRNNNIRKEGAVALAGALPLMKGLKFTLFSGNDAGCNLQSLLENCTSERGRAAALAACAAHVAAREAAAREAAAREAAAREAAAREAAAREAAAREAAARATALQRARELCAPEISQLQAENRRLRTILRRIRGALEESVDGGEALSDDVKLPAAALPNHSADE